jgi:choline/glycine/proline betaine transport protein
VGLFIARVSYGRTIKEFILGVVLVPSLMVFIWMGTFGNAAIYQELFTDINLSEAINQDISIALFSFLEQFPFSKILMGLSIVIILTFFVTSSDSGALVSAMLSSSSDTDFDEDPPMLARIVWAISLGILAVALLAGGGLSALQTSVLVTGAPFAIIIAIAAKNLLARLENLK